MALPSLPPLPHPIAIFPQFTARQCECLKLRERMLSLSGDSFHVNTHPGNQGVLQVQGSAFSLSGRKQVCDMSGQHLFTIRKQHFSIPATYYAEDPSGNKFFEVAGKWSFGKSKAVGLFSYPDPQTGQPKQARLNMVGDFFDRHADIVDEASGQPVARIDRKFFNARELLGGQQTYVVTVAQGMDLALIVAMCICLDERRNEGKNG